MGRCISIYDCSSILGIISRKWTPGYTFARQSECTNGRGRQPYVCCTADTGFVSRSELNGQRIIFPNDENDRYVAPMLTTPRATISTQISELFPKPPVCGPISVVNKIYGGEETELGEFPWLANLEYKRRMYFLIKFRLKTL